MPLEARIGCQLQTHVGAGRQNLVPYEQSVLLTAEPSLQPRAMLLIPCWFYFCWFLDITFAAVRGCRGLPTVYFVFVCLNCPDSPTEGFVTKRHSAKIPEGSPRHSCPSPELPAQECWVTKELVSFLFSSVSECLQLLVWVCVHRCGDQRSVLGKPLSTFLHPPHTGPHWVALPGWPWIFASWLLGTKIYVVAHTFNPSIQEAEAGRSLWVRSQPGLQSEFQDS